MITPSTQSSTPLLNTASGNTSGNGTVLNSDYNTFLRMLTAQMTNQDPLNPIDSSEYAAQLAAFSSVEQQVVTNDLLQNMMSLLGTGSLGDLSNWVGRDVRSEAPAYFDGESVNLAVSPAPQADRSVLEVYDDRGNLMQTVAVLPSDDMISWDGIDRNGDPFPAGEYTFVVDNLVDEESIGLTPVYTYNEVVEARSESGQILLVLDGGRILTAETVSGIRA